MLLLAGPARGDDPRTTRSDNLEYDPSTGQWTEIAPAEPGTPDGDLQLARRNQANGKYRKALKAVKRWYKTYGTDHPLYPEVALLEAAARIGNRDYYKAHTGLQAFLNEYPGTRFADQALKMEFNIAEVFLSGTRRKFLGIRILKADDIGTSILDDIANNHPDTQLAELATITKADYYYRSGDFPFAEQEYALLAQNYPRSRYTRKAVLQGARSALASFPGIRFDDAPLVQAEDRFNRYLTLYPGSAEQEGIALIIRDIAETRASKEFETGRYYQRTKKATAARYYYRSTIRYWPGTVAAIRAAEQLEALGGDPDDPDTATEETPVLLPTNDPFASPADETTSPDDPAIRNGSPDE